MDFDCDFVRNCLREDAVGFDLFEGIVVRSSGADRCLFIIVGMLDVITHNELSISNEAVCRPALAGPSMTDVADQNAFEW